MTVAYSRLPLLEATVLTSLTPVWASLFLRANYGYPVPVVVAISILPLSLAVLFVLQPWVSWHDHIAGDWLGVAGATCGSIFHSIDAVLTRRLVYGGPSEHPENSAVRAQQPHSLPYPHTHLHARVAVLRTALPYPYIWGIASDASARTALPKPPPNQPRGAVWLCPDAITRRPRRRHHLKATVGHVCVPVSTVRTYA
jgi:hypothetical protein